MTRRSLAFAGVLSGVAAVSWASVTLTPTAHNFGQVIIGVSASTRFKFTGAPTPKPSPPPTVSIAGPDAAEFVVDSGANKMATGPFFQQSSCVGPGYFVHWTQGNPCDYLVHFQPHSLGVKTARMVVVYNGETAAATLKGEGVFGCRAYLVSCNYADNYSGLITIKTVDSTTSGALIEVCGTSCS